MKRPQPNPHSRKIPPRLAELPTREVLEQYAAHARYVGSGEHKSAPWHGVAPASRRTKDANRCPPHLSHEVANAMLRAGILAGNISEDFDGAMPRRIWYHGVQGVFEARLTNRADLASGKPAGYKGWPENPDKQPNKPRDVRSSNDAI